MFGKDKNTKKTAILSFNSFIHSNRFSDVSFFEVDTIMKTLEQLVEAYGLEWDAFEETLEEMDREAFVGLANRAKHNAKAVLKIGAPNMFESVVMSILVDHQKELQQLQEHLLQPEIKTCPWCGKTSAIEEFFKGNTINDGVTILCQDCRETLFYIPSSNFEKI
jgi:hypothetical protein